jgi:hypothetical protein
MNLDARAAFLAVQVKTAEYEAQVAATAVARRLFDTETGKLATAKKDLDSAWIDLNRITKNAQLYSFDGVIYMRWQAHNQYPDNTLVPVTGFVIPPAGEEKA